MDGGGRTPSREGPEPSPASQGLQSPHWADPTGPPATHHPVDSLHDTQPPAMPPGDTLTDQQLELAKHTRCSLMPPTHLNPRNANIPKHTHTDGVGFYLAQKHKGGAEERENWLSWVTRDIYVLPCYSAFLPHVVFGRICSVATARGMGTWLDFFFLRTTQQEWGRSHSFYSGMDRGAGNGDSSCAHAVPT